MDLKNACTGNCKIYFPNNDTIYTCPRCGAAIERMPYIKGFEPYYYDISSGSVSAVNDNDSKNNLKRPRTTKNSSENLPHNTFTSDSVTHNTQRTVTANIVNSSHANGYNGVITSYETREVEQRFGDFVGSLFSSRHRGHTQHNIYFRDEEDNIEYQVQFYGEIRSVLPRPGMKIRVNTQPSGSIFRTENIYIGENGGDRIRLRNQRNNNRHNGSNAHNTGRAILITLIVLGIILLILSLSKYLPVVSEIIKTYIVVLIFLAVCVTLFRPLQFLTRQPIWLLVLSLIITLILYNAFGLASLFSGLMPSVIIIVVIIWLLRRMF